MYINETWNDKCPASYRPFPITRNTSGIKIQLDAKGTSTPHRINVYVTQTTNHLANPLVRLAPLPRLSLTLGQPILRLYLVEVSKVRWALEHELFVVRECMTSFFEALKEFAKAGEFFGGGKNTCQSWMGEWGARKREGKGTCLYPVVPEMFSPSQWSGFPNAHFSYNSLLVSSLRSSTSCIRPAAHT